MPGGTHVSRQYVLIMPNGDVAIDWGSRSYQNVHSGDFFENTSDLTLHQARDADLEQLKRTGHVETFDKMNVWFFNLPSKPMTTIE